MFVRHIDKHGKDSIYEAESVHFLPFSGNHNDDSVMVRLNQAGNRELHLDIEKNGAQLYVMNNEGRTIDSHYWESSNAKEHIKAATLSIESERQGE